MLSLFSELLFELLSCFTELLSKYALKGQKSSLVNINRWLNWYNGLLVDSWWSINRGFIHSSSSSRLNNLNSLRIFYFFLDWPLSLSRYLVMRSLLCCAKWVTLIRHWRLFWLISLGLLLLLLLGNGRLILRRWTSEMYGLIYIVAYRSFHFQLSTVYPFAGLPVL